MKSRWMIAPAQPLLADQLARSLKISPLLAQCLINRQLTVPEQIAGFLEPRLKNLGDPFLLPGMSAAVDRLLQAREAGEGLVIFGDYDVDGVTSTALLLSFLRELGWKCEYYLPNRMDEGYGLSHDAVENCLGKFPTKLLLAVDCGSSTPQSIAWLRERGVDVIVLDHHQISSPAPAASALVNPRHGLDIVAASLNGTTARGLELCSVGLAFKLAHALLKRGRETGLAGAADYDLRPLLDLVALGTIADLVPLTGENRILVSAGLSRLNSSDRPGIIALKKVAQCAGPLGTHETAFQLAPRLNAAGRLETAESALRLLLARSEAEAMPLAQALDTCNRERQAIERSICAEALGAIRSRFDPTRDFVIVEGKQPWHIGVVGIVASRILQEFYRPTIIVGGDGELFRGSGRSITGFDLAGALRECDDLLVRHGGHSMAAGLTVAPDRIELFRDRLNAVAKAKLKSEELEPVVRLDAQVGLDELTIERVKELGRLKPIGQQNPAVQLCACGLVHQRPLQRIGSQKQHVKLWISDQLSSAEAVWWGAGQESLPVGRFDLAFTPQLNTYDGRTSVQLKILDWRPSASP